MDTYGGPVVKTRIVVVIHIFFQRTSKVASIVVLCYR